MNRDDDKPDQQTIDPRFEDPHPIAAEQAPSADRLFACAVELARAEAELGRQGQPSQAKVSSLKSLKSLESLKSLSIAPRDTSAQSSSQKLFRFKKEEPTQEAPKEPLADVLHLGTKASKGGD